jgi:hypothetical protein
MIEQDKVKVPVALRPQTLQGSIHASNFSEILYIMSWPSPSPGGHMQSTRSYAIRREALYYVQVKRRSSRVLSCVWIAHLDGRRFARSSSTRFGRCGGGIYRSTLPTNLAWCTGPLRYRRLLQCCSPRSPPLWRSPAARLPFLPLASSLVKPLLSTLPWLHAAVHTLVPH